MSKGITNQIFDGPDKCKINAEFSKFRKKRAMDENQRNLLNEACNLLYLHEECKVSYFELSKFLAEKRIYASPSSVRNLLIKFEKEKGDK